MSYLLTCVISSLLLHVLVNRYGWTFVLHNHSVFMYDCTITVMNVCTFSASMLLLGRQKGRPVWRGAGMVICLDLHMAQLMPLPRTVSCFCKIQIGF